jgi:hypothetical protein
VVQKNVIPALTNAIPGAAAAVEKIWLYVISKALPHMNEIYEPQVSQNLRVTVLPESPLSRYILGSPATVYSSSLTVKLSSSPDGCTSAQLELGMNLRSQGSTSTAIIGAICESLISLTTTQRHRSLLWDRYGDPSTVTLSGNGHLRLIRVTTDSCQGGLLEMTCRVSQD